MTTRHRNFLCLTISSPNPPAVYAARSLLPPVTAEIQITTIWSLEKMLKEVYNLPFVCIFVKHIITFCAILGISFAVLLRFMSYI